MSQACLLLNAHPPSEGFSSEAACERATCWQGQGESQLRGLPQPRAVKAGLGGPQGAGALAASILLGPLFMCPQGADHPSGNENKVAFKSAPPHPLAPTPPISLTQTTSSLARPPSPCISGLIHPPPFCFLSPLCFLGVFFFFSGRGIHTDSAEMLGRHALLVAPHVRPVEVSRADK